MDSLKQVLVPCIEIIFEWVSHLFCKQGSSFLDETLKVWETEISVPYDNITVYLFTQHSKYLFKKNTYFSMKNRKKIQGR